MIGIIVSLLCAISDVFLLYHPNLLANYDGYLFLYDINPQLNTVGWVMGLTLLPLLYIGYSGAMQIADPDSRYLLRKNRWLVVVLIILGTSVHTIYKWIPAFHDVNHPLNGNEINLIKVVEFLFVGVYISFCLLILTKSIKKGNRTLFANKYFNPLVWLIVPIATTLISPAIGNYFIVSFFNCSIGFYFLGLMLTRNKVYG